MENKNNGKMMEMSEEKLEGVAGGGEAGVGELVKVELEDFSVRPGIVTGAYWSSWYGWEYYVELGHYDENNVFVSDGEEVCVYAAQVHRIYSN